jgi:steroid 5-alpha reductase family enzyme
MGTYTSKQAGAQAFLWMFLAYVGAFFGAWTALPYLEGVDPTWQVLILDTVATVIIFIFSLGFNNSSFYDPYWSIAPPFLLGFWMHPDISPQMDLATRAAWIRVLIVAVLVGFWAWRLTFNWARSWQGLRHEDWRYVDFRKKTGAWYWTVSFLGIHYFPTLLVFAGCLPFLALVNPWPSDAPLNVIDLLAATITLSAVIIETIADEQMYRFRHFQHGEGPMDKGLWGYSRHPNYFGELLFWWGIFLFAIAANPGYVWTGIGALGMTLLFVGVSIPMMEKRQKANKPGYATYQKRVSSLIPWFPSKS